LTFKDLEKRISLEAATTQQQSKLTQKLHNKSFWIWHIDKHKQEDIRANGACCFNHIIGLPQKDGVDKPLYDYEKIIFDSLVTEVGNTNSTRRYTLLVSTQLCDNHNLKYLILLNNIWQLIYDHICQLVDCKTPRYYCITQNSTYNITYVNCLAKFMYK
jgi:hypothetical protein